MSEDKPTPEDLRKGYQPLNEGYQPLGDRGYVPTAQSTLQQGIPQLPKGGSAQSQGTSENEG